MAAKIDPQLQMAFDQIDATIERVDDLKRVLNDTARELTEFTPEMVGRIPTPVPPPPVRPPSPSSPRNPSKGMYSIPTPLEPERPLGLIKKTRIPRPTPKTAFKPVPLRKLSGRFYLQIAKGSESEVLEKVRDCVEQVGRIVDSGRSPVSNPMAGWLEVAAHGNASALIERLRGLNLVEEVEKIVEIQPGQGRLQARQLDLPKTKENKSEP